MVEFTVAREATMGWDVVEQEDWIVAGQKQVVEPTHQTLSALKLLTE